MIRYVFFGVKQLVLIVAAFLPGVTLAATTIALYMRFSLPSLIWARRMCPVAILTISSSLVVVCSAMSLASLISPLGSVALMVLQSSDLPYDWIDEIIDRLG